MADILGPVGLPVYSEGQLVTQRSLGREGQLHVDTVHGTYAAQSRRGNMFCYTTGAGTIAPAIYSATAATFVLWNKSSNYFLELVELVVSHSTATAVIGGLGWAVIPGAGQALGTPISAFTELATIINLKTFQQGNPPNGKVATTATIVNPGTTNFIPIGFNEVVTTLTVSTPPPWIKQYRGEFLVPPGCAIVLCGSIAASQAVNIALTWIDNVTL